MEFNGTIGLVSTLQYSKTFDATPSDTPDALQIRKGPLLFVLTPKLSEEQISNNGRVTFTLDVWLGKIFTRQDLLWATVARKAKSISGKMSLSGSRAEWGCQKLGSGDPSENEKEEEVKLYRLRADVKLKLGDQPRKSCKLDLKLDFNLEGQLTEQMSTILPEVWRSSRPERFCLYENLGLIMNSRSDFVFRIKSPSGRVHDVGLPLSEVEGTGSTYLRQLLAAPGGTEAKRSFDGRPDFGVVKYDSDEEEDLAEERQNRTAKRTRERDQDGRRSEGPEPDDSESKKRRPNTPKDTTDRAAGALVSSNKQNAIIAEQVQSNTSGGNPTDCDKACKHVKIINVPQCSVRTLRAVVGWILSGIIIFAPLSTERDNACDDDSETIEPFIDKDGAPLPASPRSVYRLAERFGLTKLADLALTNLRSQLKVYNAVGIALSMDCWRYQDFEILVHDYVRVNLSQVYVNDPRFITHLTDIQCALLGKLVHPILWKFMTVANVLRPSFSSASESSESES